MYNTGNPLGSTDPRDFSDNSENLDRAVNNAASATWTDRFGNSRTTLAGQIGYRGTGVDGAIETYASGLVLESFSTIILYNNEFYRPSASATLPYTTTATTPDVDSNLVAVGDAVLRQDLTGEPSAGNGAALVNGATIYVGSVAELEALTVGAGYVLELNAGGRSGTFDVIAGDFSAELAADTQNGVFIGLSDDPTAATKVAKRRDSEPVRPEWFRDSDSLSGNSIALQAAGDYAFPLGLFVDCSGVQFDYDTTLDFTAYRHVFFRGDCDDTENVGEHELRFFGTGYAIDCDAIFLDKIGIRGGGDGDSIVTGRHCVRASGVVTHNYAALKQFDKIYTFTGGFYHRINGGSLRRARTVYDFQTGVYNFKVNAQHQEFVDCVSFSGGDGPLTLGGTYERFTNRIVNVTSGDPKLLTVLDSIYIENYPNDTVFPGLTGNDADKYISARAFGIRRGGIVGTGQILLNSGITNALIRFSSTDQVTDIVDLNLSLGGASTFTGTLMEGAPSQGIHYGRLKLSYLSTDAESVDILDGNLQNSAFWNNIKYNDGDGFVISTSRDIDTLFVNGWTERTGLSWNANQPKAYVCDDFIHLRMILDGSSATADAVMTLPQSLRPANRVKTTVVDGSGSVGVIQIDFDGAITTAERANEIHVNIRYPRVLSKT